MKLSYLEYFIPDEYIIQLIRFFIRVTLTIVVASSVLYLLLWLCSTLILFIHSFTDVCYTLYAATGNSPYIQIIFFVFSMLSSIKFAHMLYVSIFKEVRYER
jgi:hypothetical protein